MCVLNVGDIWLGKLKVEESHSFPDRSLRPVSYPNTGHPNTHPHVCIPTAQYAFRFYFPGLHTIHFLLCLVCGYFPP